MIQVNNLSIGSYKNGRISGKIRLKAHLKYFTEILELQKFQRQLSKFCAGSYYQTTLWSFFVTDSDKIKTLI